MATAYQLPKCSEPRIASTLSPPINKPCHSPQLSCGTGHAKQRQINSCNERPSSMGVFIKAYFLTDRIKDLSRAIRWNDWPKNYKVEQLQKSRNLLFFMPILLGPEPMYVVYHYYTAFWEGDFT